MASNSRHFFAVAVLFLLTPFIRAADDPIEYTKNGCRVVWTISEKGDSTLLIGRPLKNRGKTTDSLIRHDDGTVEFQHEFASDDACRKASVGKLLEGVHFREQNHALVFDPPNKKSTVMRYSKVAKVPVTIEFEIDKIDSQTHFGINLVNNRTIDFPTLQIDFDDQVSFSCTGTDKKRNSQLGLGLEDNAELKTPKEFHFKLHVITDESYLLSIGTSGGLGSLGFLSVRGRLSPAFGVDFEISTKDEVVAKSVVPESLGDSIGIKVRDVIESVNGEMPRSHKQMTDLLAKIQFGEQSEIAVKRNGKTVKIGFTAE